MDNFVILIVAQTIMIILVLLVTMFYTNSMQAKKAEDRDKLLMQIGSYNKEKELYIDNFNMKYRELKQELAKKEEEIKSLNNELIELSRNKKKK